MEKGKLTRIDTWRLGWLAALLVAVTGLCAFVTAGLPLFAVFALGDLLGLSASDRAREAAYWIGAALLFPYALGTATKQIVEYRGELERGEHH